MTKHFFARWQTNFLAGLAIVMPAVISVGILVWLFGTAANITDTLLIFLPRSITHQDGPRGPGSGDLHWYWSFVAFLIAIALICWIGVLAKHYFGKKLIQWVDLGLLRVPLLNKIYGAIKQVNEAFTSGKKTAFQTVVLVEFPRQGVYSIGFITSDHHGEVQAKTREHVVSVFVPTTPNPTSGFIILVPEDKLTKLEMSVPDGIKFIVSLGSISPEYPLTASSQSEAAARIEAPRSS